MKVVTDLSDKEIEKLANMVIEMLLSVRSEDYELASLHRDALEAKLSSIHRTLITKKLTTLDEEELWEQLEGLRKSLIFQVEEMLGVPEEERIYNI